jgi:hypothetical protein
MDVGGAPGGDSWLSSFGTPQRPRTVDGHALWPGPSGWSVVTVRAPPRIDYVLVCPKTGPLDWWWATGPPRGVAAVCPRYFAELRLATMLAAVCPRRTPAVFVGDLDPVAVAQYLAARRVLRRRHGPTLLYGGINDEWLAAIRRARRRSFPEDGLRIRMDRSESRLWRKLEAQVDLEQLLGPEACGVLSSGYKLELEAASNPGILRPDHKRWVFRYLRGVAFGDRVRRAVRHG